MSLKNWSKLRRVSHLGGVTSRRQQVRPTTNLTIRQKLFFRRNRLQFSGELRRNIKRRFILQLGVPLKETITKLSISVPFLTSNKEVDFSYVKGVCEKKPNKSIKKKVPVLLTQEQSQYNLKTIKIKGSYSQMRSRLQNSLWIYQNPAAVPGAIKVRRARKLHLRHRKSLQIIKLWLNRVSKIVLYTLFVQTLNVNIRKGYFSFFKVLESTMPLVLLKVGYIAIDNLNFQNVTLGATRNFIQYRNIYCNGKKQCKVWTAMIPGDYLTIQNK